MHKALLVIHTMIRAGQTDNVLGFLSGSSNDLLKLRHIANGHNDGASFVPPEANQSVALSNLEP
jgi:hypothetical protein